MKILIGVDDSPHSNAAIEFVKKMTWPKGTTVIVISAVRPVVSAYAEVSVPFQPYADEMAGELVKFHQETASNAERAFRSVGLKTEARVLHGDPRTVLTEMAHTEHADLLVVGSHGRTGMGKLLMGSVASHVVAHAQCSVIVVKLGKQPA